MTRPGGRRSARTFAGRPAQSAGRVAAPSRRRLPALCDRRLAGDGTRPCGQTPRDPHLFRQRHRRPGRHRAHGHHPARLARLGALAERRLVRRPVPPPRRQRVRQLPWPRPRKYARRVPRRRARRTPAGRGAPLLPRRRHGRGTWRRLRPWRIGQASRCAIRKPTLARRRTSSSAPTRKACCVHDHRRSDPQHRRLRDRCQEMQAAPRPYRSRWSPTRPAPARWPAAICAPTAWRC